MTEPENNPPPYTEQPVQDPEQTIQNLRNNIGRIRNTYSNPQQNTSIIYDIIGYLIIIIVLIAYIVLFYYYLIRLFYDYVALVILGIHLGMLIIFKTVVLIHSYFNKKLYFNGLIIYLYQIGMYITGIILLCIPDKTTAMYILIVHACSLG